MIPAGGLCLAIAALAQTPPPTPRLTAANPIPAWLVAAPLKTDTGTSRVAHDYLGGESRAFPDADSTWRLVDAQPNGLVNLNRVFSGGQSTAFSVAYAFVYLESPRDDTRTLILASDDDVAAWLNGQRIHYHEVARGYETDRDTLTIRLAAGWNTLLVKIVNQQGGFGFGAWIDGPPLRSAARRPAAARAGTRFACRLSARRRLARGRDRTPRHGVQSTAARDDRAVARGVGRTFVIVRGRRRARRLYHRVEAGRGR